MQALLDRAVAQGVAPAIVMGVSVSGRSTVTSAGSIEWAHGAVGAELGRFDLASLTKPLTTATWCLRLVDQGTLRLEQPIGELVTVCDSRLAEAPISRLMNHTSGLPAHRRYYEDLGRAQIMPGWDFAQARAEIHRRVRETRLDADPGAAQVYSDIGYLLLEQVCAAADTDLASAWRSLPGHSEATLHFRALPAATPVSPYAPTERCAWRERLLQAEAHDDNCWSAGGVAGHAGLFGSVADVLALGERFVSTWHGHGHADSHSLGITSDLFRLAVSPQWKPPGGSFVLGWDTPTPGASSSGRHFGPVTIGHLGFTGTSIWIDLEASVVMVLLTNRVCPTRESTGIRTFRPLVHDAAWEGLLR